MNGTYGLMCQHLSEEDTVVAATTVTCEDDVNYCMTLTDSKTSANQVRLCSTMGSFSDIEKQGAVI